MPFTYLRRAAIGLALVTAAGCTVKSTQPPPLTGPSGLALTLNVNAIPDSISQDGGSQSSVKITAIGPDGKGVSALPLRVDMFVNGTAQDFGTLSARTLVTNSDGVATVVYTAPPAPPNGVFTPCPSSSLPGSCVTIVATPTATNFTTANPQSVLIRLVPTGVILPPASSPTAAFTVSPTPAIAGVVLNFDGSTSQVGANATQIVTYSWNFGDGTTGTGKTPTHTFSAASTFNVTLTVTNDRGLSSPPFSLPIAVTAAPVNAGSQPTAVFTFSPAAPGVGDTVFFNASTSVPGTGHTISSYAWTFGDGTTGTGATTTHAFTTAGSYSVQLKVTDDDGQATTSGATTVAVGSPPSPTASFTFSPATPGRFDQVVFDASSSTTAQGQTIVDVAWNFGDGTAVIHCPGGASTDCPGPTNRISAHTFQTATSFIVNLVVTDTAGRIGSVSKTVSVDLAQPKVIVSASPGSPNPGTLVNFNSNGTTYFSGSYPPSFPVTFNWSFGDGSGSALANPSHAYAAIGSYTATLSVTDNKGRTGIGTVSVNVVAVTPPTPPTPPAASFTFGPPSPKAGVTNVLFDGSGSTGSNLTYTWNFGDGTTSGPSGNATINHVYAAAGPYSVTLRVTDTLSLLSNTSAAQTVTVVP